MPITSIRSRARATATWARVRRPFSPRVTWAGLGYPRWRQTKRLSRQRNSPQQGSQYGPSPDLLREWHSRSQRTPSAAAVLFESQAERPVGLLTPPGGRCIAARKTGPSIPGDPSNRHARSTQSVRRPALAAFRPKMPVTGQPAGQLEHPSEVNNSSSTGTRAFSLALRSTAPVRRPTHNVSVTLNNMSFDIIPLITYVCVGSIALANVDECVRNKPGHHDGECFDE